MDGYGIKKNKKIIKFPRKDIGLMDKTELKK